MLNGDRGDGPVPHVAEEKQLCVPVGLEDLRVNTLCNTIPRTFAQWSLEGVKGQTVAQRGAHNCRSR